MSDLGWKDFETLESFIAQQQSMHSQSRGAFSSMLRRIGVASKVISTKVQKAGLLDILGARDNINVQGEQQMKLDAIANEIIKSTFSWMPAISGIASEEEQDVVLFPSSPDEDGDRYVILFDPLDGSSNIDANVSIGTIFSIYKCLDEKKHVSALDFLQPGTKQAAAGYIIYGSSTMLVYTTGQGVHGFTLDPEIGEYVLSHENIKIPDKCHCFSANETNYNKWDEASRRFTDYIRSKVEDRYKETSSRYIGSLVADVHRNLLYGGVFMYPTDAKTGKGKLRLLYECSPMAMIVEQAGGKASTGCERILSMKPKELHQRIPIIIGNIKDVELYEKMVKEFNN